MAFTLNTFQFNRGIGSCSNNGTGVSTVTHGYKSADTYATITTPGYFPANIDNSTDKVFVGDLISVVASDTVGLILITALDPFTVGANLLGTAGSPITIAAPIAATTTNAAIITGTSLQLEIADQTHPGILTTGAQAFSGTKLFMSGTQFLTSGGSASTLNYYEEATHVTIFNLGTEMTAPITFQITRIGRMVNFILIMGGTTTVAQGAPGAAYVGVTPLPVRFRPAFFVTNTWEVTNAATLSAGLISINTSGVINIYNSPDTTTPFTTAQINGFREGCLTYSV